MSVTPVLEREETLVSDREVEFFQSEGFLMPQHGLGEEDTRKLRSIMNDIIRDNPGMSEVAVLPYVPYRGIPGEGLVGGERLFEFAVHPNVLGVVRRLLGPNALLWGGEVLVKPAKTGRESAWHQDCVVSCLRPGAGHREPRGVNVWIAIDDVDTENSCLRFVPGSAKHGRQDHHLDRKDTTQVDAFPFSPDTTGLALDEAVDAVLPAGHFSVHDLYVMHGSNPNTSGRQRVAVTFRYLDATDSYDRNFGTVMGTAYQPGAGKPIWLVLGENRNEKNNFMIGHEFLDELDRLAEKNRELMAMHS